MEQPLPLAFVLFKGRLFGQVPCLRTRPAVIDECFTRAGRKGVTLPLPCWYAMPWGHFDCIWLDRSAVKQAPHPSARIPDPLPGAAGGLSGPQVSARGACGQVATRKGEGG